MGGQFETLGPISAACATTAAAMYPVDVARALKMASATGGGLSMGEFIKLHGVRGLVSQGVGPEIARATGMRILKFFFFPVTHEAIWKKPTSKGTWYEKAIAGAIAVTPEVMAITTLEAAKIGLQLDSEKKYKNSGAAVAKDLYGKYGVRGLFVGWQGVQARQMLWTSTYFATLSSFKNLSNGVLGKGPYSDFTAGFAAGVVGALVNTPADLIRTNIQKDALQNGIPKGQLNSYAFSFGRMATVGSEILAVRGASGLYFGIGFKCLHMGGSGAFVAMLIPIFSKIMGVKKDIM
eukprot:Lithocolla_globosa_v1_NODE_1676_length_2403_cov_9.212521.p2 type:complete len:293 gc:universal NODE_1676_length_2403_cov_9.212521:1125-247(-)